MVRADGTDHQSQPPESVRLPRKPESHTPTRLRTRRIAAAGAVFGLFVAGCAGSARVELSAADSIEALAAELQAALDEYQSDLSQVDAERERLAVLAFISRVKTAVGEDSQMQAHGESLLGALERVRADRLAATNRFMAARENALALGEVAAGLRRIAVESMSVDDEVKRYFQSWMSVPGGSGQDAEAARRRNVRPISNKTGDMARHWMRHNGDMGGYKPNDPDGVNDND